MILNNILLCVNTPGNNMKPLKVINLFAGPGAGKSTTAAGLFFEMKQLGYNVELVSEYAKEKVYDGHLGCLEDQIYIFGKQQRRLNRLVGHVEWAITDSPLPLCIIYNKEDNFHLNELILQSFNSYHNYNFFIDRVKPYVKIGRTQEETEAIFIDHRLKGLLFDESISYQNIDGDENAVTSILKLMRLK